MNATAQQVIRTNNMSEIQKKTQKNIINLRNLRLSLKYRPEILNLILKMRLCIRKKNSLILKLKDQLKLALDVNLSCLTSTNETNSFKVSLNKDIDENMFNEHEVKQNENKVNAYSQTDQTSLQTNELEINEMQIDKGPIKKDTYDSSTQTDKRILRKSISVSSDKKDHNKEAIAWNINNKDGVEEKSIAEQVKEVAQSALQQSGMVYVESAGMYYDYKTGYYYNSELGLYYHTDTGCYYYYSDEKQTFEFHSYPDRGAVSQNAALIAHEKRKARKHKKAMKTEDEIENLTKNLSQDKEEDASEQACKPKRRKKSNKMKKDDSELSSNDDRTIASHAKPDTHKDIQITDESKANVQIEIENETSLVKSENKDTNEEKTNEDKMDSSSEDLEDGECSETDSEVADGNNDNSDTSTSTASDDESIAKHHPPCMRVIVRETNLPKLKVGSLFLVTKDGGTVGREGDQHTILLRDHNVSRNHLDIRYNVNRRVYMVIDLGSKNGTILNGSRMSESQIVSEPMEVLHGSIIQLGETKLLCHIHPGNDTCGHCEPGLIMETQEKEKKVAYTRTCSVQKQHQLELARLKNKYAPKQLMIEETAYNDRAQARRDAVGSSHHSEKTQSSDLDTPLAPENKGFKLLQRMGWSKGEGLGKDSQGDTEPIPLVNNEGKVGLGNPGSASSPAVAPTIGNVNTLGPATLRLASRTKMLKPPAKAFQGSFDDDSD